MQDPYFWSSINKKKSTQLFVTSISTKYFSIIKVSYMKLLNFSKSSQYQVFIETFFPAIKPKKIHDVSPKSHSVFSCLSFFVPTLNVILAESNGEGSPTLPKYFNYILEGVSKIIRKIRSRLFKKNVVKINCKMRNGIRVAY